MSEKGIISIAEPIDSKEAKKLVAKMQAAVEVVDVTDEKKVTAAKEGIKKLKSYVKQQMSKYIDPAKAIIAEAKEQYDPWIEACDAAEALLKRKVIEYVMEQRKKEDEAKQKLAARVEKGTMKAETAVRKMDELPETKANQGGVKVRMIKDYQVTDESKIPAEFWTRTLNTALIRKVALQEGTAIPGIEVFEKPSGSF